MNAQSDTSTKLDIFQIVTNRIIALLEEGTLPWQKPWSEAGLPANLISKRPYRGLNVWLLLSLNYQQNLFLTWDQLKKLGGSVKAGEKGHVVVYWRTVKKEEDFEKATDTKARSILRYYKVFNLAQVTGIPESMIPQLEHSQDNPITECDAIVANMPQCPSIKFKENRAYYHIVEDYINMPKRKSFKSGESYYSTLFHELVHCTGHEKRLNRKTLTEMAGPGSESYSIEELVAEMGACYLTSFVGIINTEIKNSAAYINGWLEKLRNDKRFVLFASSYAQRAADFILNVKPLDEKEPDEQISPM